MGTIGLQKKPPLSVSFAIALQGIRIRLGRTFLTISGVALGTAFLTATLANQTYSKIAAGEIESLAEARRMIAFLESETGNLQADSIDLYAAGSLEKSEQKLFEILRGKGAKLSKLQSDLAMNSGKEAGRYGDFDPVSNLFIAAVVAGDEIGKEFERNEVLKRYQYVAFCRKDAMQSLDQASVRYINLDRELSPEDMSAQKTSHKLERRKLLWISSISLAVTIMCISNSMLISVYDRFREIGTMKCLGALSSFIRDVFLIESLIVGLAGSCAGVLLGNLFAFFSYGFVYGFSPIASNFEWGIFLLQSAACLAIGIAVSVLAAVYPAKAAAAMLPASALRSSI